MRRLAALMVLVVLAVGGGARAGELASPPPDWDHPRKLVLQLDSDDPHKVNGIFDNVVNTQKFYGLDNVKIAVVAYGPGVRALLKASAPAPERVAALIYTQVEMVACGITLSSLGKTKADLLPGVTVTPAGVPELMERQLKGWIYVAP